MMMFPSSVNDQQRLSGGARIKTFETQSIIRIARLSSRTVNIALLMISNEDETAVRFSHGFLLVSCVIVSHDQFAVPLLKRQGRLIRLLNTMFSE